MRRPERLKRQGRRRFHRYLIEDPRPIAETAPYTFYLPSENELLAIMPGDLVQLIFRSAPPSREWDGERMWVTVAETGEATLGGRLENEPLDMPQLQRGDKVRFRRADVINIVWSESRTVEPPTAPPHREYWDRCLVDAWVLEEDAPVQLLYREEPDLGTEDDEYPDSGWRIRGDPGARSSEEIESEPPRYIALGAVLNHDDSWLHLIDAPIGSRFVRDAETGHFQPEIIED